MKLIGYIIFFYVEWKININLYKMCQLILMYYSALRLMGSRIIESAAYWNQILLTQLYIDKAQNKSVNWISRLLLSLLCWSEVILLSGGHCILLKNYIFIEQVDFFNNAPDISHIFEFLKFFINLLNLTNYLSSHFDPIFIANRIRLFFFLSSFIANYFQER
jgi:hypothetical protein